MIKNKKVSDKMYRDALETFDNTFPEGVFAIPRPTQELRIKTRALLDYCESKQITPDKLSEQEMKQFLSKKGRIG